LIEQFDPAQVNWARGQFALTAMYHWLFASLTLGFSFLLAFFETIYVRTGNEEWKRITKFWMKLFAVNFAIGIATGIILEFEFGTNWSNYSWMVGDIFGAPLAAEGLFAFFIEATFFAMMFFGWDRVSKRAHLLSTWMVAIGANLSALWILVANAWMQHPVGMRFNPDSARFEMESFSQVLFSPVALDSFTHATASGFVLAALFIAAVSCWYLLKGRHLVIARRSLVVASCFGLLASLYLAFTGDASGQSVGRHQPMKLAAMEGLYTGERGAALTVAGILDPDKEPDTDDDPFFFSVKVPYLLSLLSTHSTDSFIAGIDDLLYGNSAEGIEGVSDRMASGKIAVAELSRYREARKRGDVGEGEAALAAFTPHWRNLGYGFLTRAEEAVPPVGLSFYSFRVMVALGTFFPLLFALLLLYALRGVLPWDKWLLRIGVAAFFLGLVATEAGWVVTEVGRQPWAIQGLLPVSVARSNLTVGTVQTTFFIFLALFTALLVAEARIMTRLIRIGPEEN